MPENSDASVLHPKDHDLLIRLDENVKNLVQDVRTIRDDTTRRLTTVETTKVDKDDFEDFKKMLAAETAKQQKSDRDAFELFRTAVTQTEKEFNTRITKIESKLLIATGVIITLQFLIPIALKLWLNI